MTPGSLTARAIPSQLRKDRIFRVTTKKFSRSSPKGKSIIWRRANPLFSRGARRDGPLCPPSSVDVRPFPQIRTEHHVLTGSGPTRWSAPTRTTDFVEHGRNL